MRPPRRRCEVGRRGRCVLDSLLGRRGSAYVGTHRSLSVTNDVACASGPLVGRGTRTDANGRARRTVGGADVSEGGGERERGVGLLGDAEFAHGRFSRVAHIRETPSHIARDAVRNRLTRNRTTDKRNRTRCVTVQSPRCSWPLHRFRLRAVRVTAGGAFVPRMRHHAGGAI